MTSEQLIEEGRKLQPPSVFLRPEGPGPVAAIWRERDDDELESTGHHCWLTVDARHVPGLPPSVTGYLSVFADEENCEGGRVEVTQSWPKRAGIKTLRPYRLRCCRPSTPCSLAALRLFGEWIQSHGFERTDRYNNNFKGRDIVEEYQRIWMERISTLSKFGHLRGAGRVALAWSGRRLARFD